jgi:Flp pilus assembly pilin Flp
MRFKPEQQQQRGATMLEYAILVAFISMTVLAAALILGSRINYVFCSLPWMLATRSQDAGGGEGEGGDPCLD